MTPDEKKPQPHPQQVFDKDLPLGYNDESLAHHLKSHKEWFGGWQGSDMTSFFEITGLNLCWICQYHNCGENRIKGCGACRHPNSFDRDFFEFGVFDCFKIMECFS